MSMNLQQQVKDRLQQAGYKYTQPRKEVANVLLNNHEHLTAPQIVEAVASQNASVGRMSVYRTLDLFTRLGLIRPAFPDNANARYIVVMDGHHHHLVCHQCGEVIHFDDLACPVAQIEATLSERFGFQIDGHLLEFFGVCEDCQS